MFEVDYNFYYGMIFFKRSGQSKFFNDFVCNLNQSSFRKPWKIPAKNCKKLQMQRHGNWAIPECASLIKVARLSVRIPAVMA